MFTTDEINPMAKNVQGTATSTLSDHHLAFPRGWPLEVRL